MIPAWLTAVLQVITGDLLGQLSRAYQAKLDAESAEARLVHEQRIKDIEAKLEQQRTAKDFALGQMNHPVWWLAWLLFVLPVAMYHAAIFFVSTFPQWGWEVQEVPGAQEEWARWVVLSIFGAQIIAGGLGRILRGR